jgi:hypothetical protein
MSDKVIGGRGHKISPVGKGNTGKIAYSYSPCPKIDPDGPENCMSLGLLPTPNGNFFAFFIKKFKSISLNF